MTTTHLSPKPLCETTPQPGKLVCAACGYDEFRIHRPAYPSDAEWAECLECSGFTIVTHMRTFTVEDWANISKS